MMRWRDGGHAMGCVHWEILIVARADTQTNTIHSPNAILILSVHLTSKQKKCLSVYMDAPEKQGYHGGRPRSITTGRTPDAIVNCEVSGRENIRVGEVNEVAGSTPVHYLRQRDLARGHSIREVVYSRPSYIRR